MREGTEIPANSPYRFLCKPHTLQQPTPLLFQELQVTVRRLADSAFSIIIPNFPIELSHDLIPWLHLESISIVQLLQLQELIVAKSNLIELKVALLQCTGVRRGGFANFHFPISLWLNHHPKGPRGVENISVLLTWRPHGGMVTVSG